MFLSVTRLRIRCWWYLPGLAVRTFRIRSQLQRSAGFRGGTLATELPHVFWTITVWDDEKAMRVFRNSEAHLKAMPRLSQWCDEASYVHWEQGDAALPDAELSFQRLRDDGKLSKVRHPSEAHKSGEKVGSAPPRIAGAIPVPQPAL